MLRTLKRNLRSTVAETIQRLKSITFETAVRCNLKYLRFLSFFSGAPINVKGGEVLVDESQLKRLLRTASLGVLWLRTLFIAGAIVLSLNVDRFWNPFFLPLYILMLTASAAAGYVGHSVLTSERGCFAMTWNFIASRKSTVKSPKLLVLVMYVFVPSVCACILGMNFLLAFNPQLVIQFRFAVEFALEEGFLTVGPTYWALVVISTFADFFSFLLTGAVNSIVAISQMTFFETWSSVMNQLLNSCKRRRAFSNADVKLVWQKVQELVVAIRVFNVGNAAAVFSFKLICLTSSISSVSALLLLDFNGNFLFMVIMLYASIAASTGYPTLYHRAYGVSSGLQKAKRELLKFKQLDRRLEAVSPRGVQVGSFYSFERESDLIYCDFIVKQVTSIILL